MVKPGARPSLVRKRASVKKSHRRNSVQSSRARSRARRTPSAKRDGKRLSTRSTLVVFAPPKVTGRTTINNSSQAEESRLERERFLNERRRVSELRARAEVNRRNEQQRQAREVEAERQRIADEQTAEARRQENARQRREAEKRARQAYEAERQRIADEQTAEARRQQNARAREERIKRGEMERSLSKGRALEGTVNGTVEQAQREIAWANSEIRNLHDQLSKNPTDDVLLHELSEMINSKKNYETNLEARRRNVQIQQRTADLYKSMTMDVPAVGTVTLRAIENSRGGNCLFESVSQALRGTNDFRAIRNEVADAILADQQGLIMSDLQLQHLTQSDPNYQSLVEMEGSKLRKAVAEGNRGTLPGIGSGWWGDIVTLQYASRLYHTRFIILGGSSSNSVEPQNFIRTVVLWYDQDTHYALTEFDIPNEGPVRRLSSSASHQSIARILLNQAGGGINRRLIRRMRGEEREGQRVAPRERRWR